MNLTKRQCIIIKGLAISLIVLHNIVHLLLNIPCNEWSYDYERTSLFLANLFTTSSIWYILSYAGWIGVALFIFLSGYGLTKKYNQHQTEFKFFPYLKNHIIKLLKLLIPIYVLYVLLDWGVFHHSTNIISVLAHMTCTINILMYGDSPFILSPGVYWFFGLILQLYILFAFIRKLSTKWLWALALGFLLFNYFILYFVSEDTMLWCRLNFMGWGDPFVLGMIAAKTNISVIEKHKSLVGLLSFIVLCASLITKPLTPFIELSTILCFISISYACDNRWVYYLGILSPSIFVIHPFIRMLFMNCFWHPYHPFIMTVLFIIPVILFSWAHHVILAKTDKLIKH
jgi:peptidoglycan/LPS O-acetylase OafA/YrhL